MSSEFSLNFSFCKASGVTEHFLGILYGAAAGFGFLGSICFPVLRSKIGLNFTALVGKLPYSILIKNIRFTFQVYLCL